MKTQMASEFFLQGGRLGPEEATTGCGCKIHYVIKPSKVHKKYSCVAHHSKVYGCVIAIKGDRLIEVA